MKGLNVEVTMMESSAFTALTEQIAKIAVRVRAVSGGRKGKSPDRLLTTREAAHLLNVSCRTLQHMRGKQRTAYAVLRGRYRYRQSEINRLLGDNTVTDDVATPERMKRNHTLRAGGKPKGRRTQDMELLTRDNFENWMQKVTERLDRQDGMLFFMQPSGKAPNPMDGIKLFNNQDLCILFQISECTLRRYRSIGALPYRTLGKKTYCSEADVLTFLSEHVKGFRKEDMAFCKACIHNFFQK